jgi:hypothetical protein
MLLTLFFNLKYVGESRFDLRQTFVAHFERPLNFAIITLIDIEYIDPAGTDDRFSATVAKMLYHIDRPLLIYKICHFARRLNGGLILIRAIFGGDGTPMRLLSELIPGQR